MRLCTSLLLNMAHSIRAVNAANHQTIDSICTNNRSLKWYYAAFSKYPDPLCNSAVFMTDKRNRAQINLSCEIQMSVRHQDRSEKGGFRVDMLLRENGPTLIGSSKYVIDFPQERSFSSSRRRISIHLGRRRCRIFYGSCRCSGTISRELLRFNDDVSVSSSGIVANFFRTCLRAGRRIGLLKK